MNAIEKTIFDTLAAGRGINLPGIGALYVEQRPAEFISGKSLRPPYNRIAFSPAENPAYPSAGTLEGYEEWALHSQQEGDVREINGVGVLRGGVFYPAVELYELLNPQGTEPVPVKPRYGTGRKLLIGIGVIAVAALVMAVVVQISRFADRKADTGETPAAIRIAREEAAGASSRGESTIAPAVAEEVKEETVADNNRKERRNGEPLRRHCGHRNGHGERYGERCDCGRDTAQPGRIRLSERRFRAGIPPCSRRILRPGECRPADSSRPVGYRKRQLPESRF